MCLKENEYKNILKNNKIQINKKNKIDGKELLKTVCDGVVATVFFDPQYRGVLDKMHYGNEGARQSQRVSLPQMNEETIKSFIKEIYRVLRPSGYLFLWVDKFHLCQGINEWIENTELQIVDLLVWNKGKIGMGYRTRRKSEYLIIIQKKPIKAKAFWTDHAIPDVWDEKIESKNKKHPHSKPYELQKRLIEATTQEGEIVLDPASGGFTIYDICIATNRIFIGSDLIYGEI